MPCFRTLDANDATQLLRAVSHHKNGEVGLLDTGAAVVIQTKREHMTALMSAAWCVWQWEAGLGPTPIVNTPKYVMDGYGEVVVGLCGESGSARCL